MAYLEEHHESLGFSELIDDEFRLFEDPSKDDALHAVHRAHNFDKRPAHVDPQTGAIKATEYPSLPQMQTDTAAYLTAQQEAGAVLPAISPNTFAALFSMPNLPSPPQTPAQFFHHSAAAIKSNPLQGTPNPVAPSMVAPASIQPSIVPAIVPTGVAAAVSLDSAVSAFPPPPPPAAFSPAPMTFSPVPPTAFSPHAGFHASIHPVPSPHPVFHPQSPLPVMYAPGAGHMPPPLPPQSPDVMAHSPLVATHPSQSPHVPTHSPLVHPQSPHISPYLHSPHTTPYAYSPYPYYYPYPPFYHHMCSCPHSHSDHSKDSACKKRRRSSLSVFAETKGADDRATSRSQSPSDESISEGEELEDGKGKEDEGEIYKCTFKGCKKVFTRPYNLKSHMKIHSGEKQFQCTFCPSKFTRGHDLKRHIRLHTNERPFACPHCDERFSRSDAVRRHIQIENCGPERKEKLALQKQSSSPETQTKPVDQESSDRAESTTSDAVDLPQSIPAVVATVETA
ncbi:uncharacterized protein BJ171DRAFT_303409 [Polychytrium aggregatum]|uniref:uncharacterized protein n=1 Tax=Polychytrium aggregatum TaxID=110093 RepID=UPI0022FF187B|nr:uncharacterized protein BJ171DRAFT_303409 [Polychytrium aggregatum]KAI9193131.1 hypothetical protein BJ171DRAFT_303409 [Polychytrium aggregatum]